MSFRTATILIINAYNICVCVSEILEGYLQVNILLYIIISQVDPMSCASSGMFVNLSAVMLRLCEPFLDANLTKRDKIDPKYVFYSDRLDWR